MHEHLERLQEKPKHVRVQYAFWTSFGITLCIALFWFWGLVDSLSPVAVPEREVESSFFGELKEVVGGFAGFPMLFRGEVEYASEESQKAPTVELIDLDALVASSSERTKPVPVLIETTSKASSQ